MAKVAYSKLALKVNKEVKTITINDQDIEVKQYLPIDEKLALIGNVINQAADENNFSNPVKLDVFTNLEIIFAYTNLSFTEKQKEDLVKLYDVLESNDIFNQVIAAIPRVEYCGLVDAVQDCSDAIYTYRNSILGILETVSQDYKDVNFDAKQIQESLGNPENLAFLREVLSKMA